MTDKFDYKKFEEELTHSLKNNKDLTGKNSPMTKLLKHFIEKSLDSEYEKFQETDSSPNNRKNGKNSKKVKSSYG